ncbi:MAG: glycosyltransferase family 39 protein, partial [Chthoniobacterales bacterium]
IYSVAGKYNWYALHLSALLWTLATMGGLYTIGRALFDTRTGLVAALLYSLFQPAISFKNIQFDGELLMNLPIVWACAIAFASDKAKSRPLVFLAGLLCCLAFLLKQPGAIAAVPLGLYLLLPAYRASRSLTTADCLRQFAIFAAGFWITLGLAVLFLYQQGILRDAIYWTMRDHASTIFFPDRCLRSTAIFVAACLPLLVAALSAHDVWIAKRAEWCALVMLLIASAIGVSAGGRFYSHYYNQLLPPLALLAAPFFSRGWFRKANAFSRWLCHPAILGIWVVLTIVIFPIVKWRELIQFRQPTAAGVYLREHHSRNARLFVWGQMPRIYLQAQMRPACRYVSTFALTGYVFGGPIPGLDTHSLIRPGAWENLQHDFALHPPEYIVDVQNEDVNYKISDFPILRDYIAKNFVLDARTAEGPIYRRITP